MFFILTGVGNSAAGGQNYVSQANSHYSPMEFSCGSRMSFPTVNLHTGCVEANDCEDPGFVVLPSSTSSRVIQRNRSFRGRRQIQGFSN